MTTSIPHSLHVRLIESREKRVSHFTNLRGMSEEEAGLEVNRLDRARKRYVKTNFGRDVEDPLFYDLVINTDEFDTGAVCRLLRLALEEKCR